MCAAQKHGDLKCQEIMQYISLSLWWNLKMRNRHYYPWQTKHFLSAIRAGEALSSGVTPDSVLHSPVCKAQDGDKTQAIDIDKDESNHTKHNEGSRIPVPEVINLESSDDEDDVHGPERETVHPPRAMNGGNIHREQPESAPRAALHALGAMNARGDMNWDLEYEAERARDNGVPLFTRLWHYADPQGITRGPYQLIQLWEWKREGYFDASFKVWMAGQRKEQAILLTDAFRSVR